MKKKIKKYMREKILRRNKKIISIFILSVVILTGVVFAFQKNGQMRQNNKSLLDEFGESGFRNIQRDKNSEQEKDLRNYSAQLVLVDNGADDNSDSGDYNSSKEQKLGVTQSLNFLAEVGNSLFGIKREMIFQPVNKMIEFRENTTVSKIIKVPEDYSTIQLAIDNANKRDTVKVSAGEYNENIVMKEGVNVVGSNVLVISKSNKFSEKKKEEETELNSEDSELSFVSSLEIINETIIDGGNSGNVVTFKNGITNKTKLANFTIRNAGKNLSGILIEDSSPFIHDNVIMNNEYNIYIKGNSSPIIQKNSLRFGGKGIQVYNFKEEKETKTTFTNVVSSPIIIDNLITDNKIGIDLYQTSALIDHNTISYNNHYKTYLGATFGIYIIGSSAEISNNIITDSGICDLCAGVNIDEKSKGVTLSYNNIWNNKNNFVCFGECILEDNNISEEPMFIDPANWNFELQEESGLIGKGRDGSDIGVRW